MTQVKLFHDPRISSPAYASLGAIVALYFIAANLPVLLFDRVFAATPHGLFSVEYLLIGAAGIFLPRRTVFLLLAAEALADCTYSICYTFQFSLHDLLASLRYLTLLPHATVLMGCALLPAVLLFFAVVAQARPRPGMHLRTALVLVSLAVALVPADLVLGGRNAAWQVGDVALLPFRLARAPLLALTVREIKTNKVYANANGAEVAPMAAASDQAIALLAARPAGAPMPNVVLVVVESWGALADPQLASALTAAYSDPRLEAGYTASYGAVPFTGLTVPGEARELCHSTVGFGIVHLAPPDFARCLPALLHARGYRNIAIHGYVGQMFSRAAWYPRMGFDETWFAPDLKRAGLPNCVGAFAGICDQSIAAWIGRSLGSQDSAHPSFHYWVTLNSHVPEPARPDLPSDEACSTRPALDRSTALCSWFRIIHAVHQSIARVAVDQATGNLRPTVFILVGDHAPPFGDPLLARQFSSTQVPFVMLTPRALAAR